MTTAVQTRHAGHGARATEVVPEAASQARHHDHGAAAAAAPTTTERAAALAGAAQASHARLMATCTDCCFDGGVVPATGLTAERRDAKAASVAATTQLASRDLFRAVLATLPPSPLTPATIPARSLLALRI